MSTPSIHVRLFLAPADGGPALLGLELPALRLTPADPDTPLLVLSTDGMRAAAADPVLVQAPSVFHLGRLFARGVPVDPHLTRASPEAIVQAVAAVLDPKSPGDDLAQRIAQAGSEDLAEL